MIDHFHERYGMRIKTVGADKRYFAKFFLAAPFKQVTHHAAHLWPTLPDGRRCISR